MPQGCQHGWLWKGLLHTPALLAYGKAVPTLHPQGWMETPRVVLPGFGPRPKFRHAPARMACELAEDLHPKRVAMNCAPGPHPSWPVEWRKMRHRAHPHARCLGPFQSGVSPWVTLTSRPRHVLLAEPIEGASRMLRRPEMSQERFNWGKTVYSAVSHPHPSLASWSTPVA